MCEIKIIRRQQRESKTAKKVLAEEFPNVVKTVNLQIWEPSSWISYKENHFYHRQSTRERKRVREWLREWMNLESIHKKI